MKLLRYTFSLTHRTSLIIYTLKRLYFILNKLLDSSLFYDALGIEKATAWGWNLKPKFLVDQWNDLPKSQPGSCVLKSCAFIVRIYSLDSNYFRKPFQTKNNMSFKAIFKPFVHRWITTFKNNKAPQTVSASPFKAGSKQDFTAQNIVSCSSKSRIHLTLHCSRLCLSSLCIYIYLRAHRTEATTSTWTNNQ